MKLENQQTLPNFKSGLTVYGSKGNISLIWQLTSRDCTYLEFRTEILARRRERQQRRQELTKRKSAAAQERMRILSMLAKTGGTGSSKKKEDTFGMRDEDWDIYKAVSKVHLIKRWRWLTVKYFSMLTFCLTNRTEAGRIAKQNKRS